MKGQPANPFCVFCRFVTPAILYYCLFLLFEYVFSKSRFAEAAGPLSSCLILPLLVSVYCRRSVDSHKLLSISAFAGYAAVFWILMKHSSVSHFVGFCIAGPISEEIVFRGWAYSRGKELLGSLWGAVLVSLLFAVGHDTFPQIIFAFFAGCMLSYIREKGGSLWMPILLHIGWNTTQVMLFEQTVFKL